MTPTVDALLRSLLRRAGGAVELTHAELQQPASFLLRETRDGVHLELIEL